MIENFHLSMLEKKRELIDGHLISKYGLSEKDIQRGYRINENNERDPIHENVTREYFERIQNPEKNL